MCLIGVAGLVFFGGFLPMFFFGGSLPKMFGKILLMSGLVFFGFVLSSFGFFRRRRFFWRETVQVVIGHPLARTCVACSLFLYVSRRFCLFRPFWPCVLLLGGFSGCHSGPRAFLGFSRDFSEAFFLDARRQGFSCASLVLFFFLPFCFAATLFLEGPGVVSLTWRVVLPTPRRSDSQGTAQFWAGLLAAPFWGF